MRTRAQQWNVVRIGKSFPLPPEKSVCMWPICKSFRKFSRHVIVFLFPETLESPYSESDRAARVNTVETIFFFASYIAGCFVPKFFVLLVIIILQELFNNERPDSLTNLQCSTRQIICYPRYATVALWATTFPSATIIFWSRPELFRNHI